MTGIPNRITVTNEVLDFNASELRYVIIHGSHAYGKNASAMFRSWPGVVHYFRWLQENNPIREGEPPHPKFRVYDMQTGEEKTLDVVAQIVTEDARKE